MSHPALLALLLLLSACVPAPPPTRPSRDDLFISAGDPAAGRRAFVELSCTSCHTVHGDTDLPSPVSANPGPMLGPAQARQALGRLVTSIVSPSHSIPIDIRARSQGSLSPMADYTDAMTVRQLVDLVAYLRGPRPGDRAGDWPSE